MLSGARCMSAQTVRSVLLAGAIAVLSGCGDTQVDTSGGLPAPSPTAALDASSTPSTNSENELVLKQYRAFFDTLTPVSAVQDADEQARILRGVAVEPELTRSLGSLNASIAQGEVDYGQEILNPRVVDLSGDVAHIEDCQDGSQAGRKNAATGEKITVGSKNDFAKVVMRRDVDGVWKVSEIEYQPAGSCDENS